MLVLRFFVWLVSLLSFGFVSLGAVTYSLVDEGEYFDQTITFEDYLLANFEKSDLDPFSYYGANRTLGFIQDMDIYDEYYNSTLIINADGSVTFGPYEYFDLLSVGSGVMSLWNINASLIDENDSLLLDYGVDEIDLDFNNLYILDDSINFFQSFSYYQNGFNFDVYCYVLPVDYSGSLDNAVLWLETGYDVTNPDFISCYIDFFGSYENFEVEDFDVEKNVEYTFVANELSINDVVLMICFALMWFLIIRMIGGIVYVRFNT
ncbi:MAG: hypothetical protein PHO75_04520 [Candidatus Shapirobacteria bacterium]|nr:hypothetical protein [Candidatus Shapirobacteria bacterium]